MSANPLPQAGEGVTGKPQTVCDVVVALAVVATVKARAVEKNVG